MKLTDLVESQDLSFDEYMNKLPKEIVDKLKTAEQNPKWHPEGNVFNHIRQVFNNVKVHGKDYAIAAIFHDLGKLDTESRNHTGVHHYGHEKESMKYLDKYLHLFPFENKQLIYDLVEHHMRATRYHEDMSEKKRRELEKHPNFEHLMNFTKADTKRE